MIFDKRIPAERPDPATLANLLRRDWLREPDDALIEPWQTPRECCSR